MNTIENHLLDNVKEYVGFARKRVSDPELAADAVQESLLKALKAANQIRDEETAKAWFYRILRRTIIDLTAAATRRIERSRNWNMSSMLRRTWRNSGSYAPAWSDYCR